MNKLNRQRTAERRIQPKLNLEGCEGDLDMSTDPEEKNDREVRGPERVVFATPADLSQILGWLEKEYHEDKCEGFWCNRRIIKCSLGDDLYVIRDGPDAVAFQVGKHSADIVSVKKTHRRKGLGSLLFQAALQRAIDDDVVVLQGECAPSSSLPFWQKLGFERFREPRIPNGLTVRRVLGKTFAIPEDGQKASVTVGFYPQSSQHSGGATVDPIAFHHVGGVVSSDGRVLLERRIIGLSDDEPAGRDLAVRVEVDGQELCFSKCKHDVARHVGVQPGLVSAFFLDTVNLRSFKE